MLVSFHIFQAIGFFGFGNWLPALLARQGADSVHGLGYAFAISLAYPLAPLLLVGVAQRWENKWQVVVSALGRGAVRPAVRLAAAAAAADRLRRRR